MLAKTEERKQQKQVGGKRRHLADDGGGEKKKKSRGEGAERGQADAGRKRLDALSVGYFRRVGERLNEGFEDDEERGWWIIALF